MYPAHNQCLFGLFSGGKMAHQSQRVGLNTPSKHCNTLKGHKTSVTILETPNGERREYPLREKERSYHSSYPFWY